MHQGNDTQDCPPDTTQIQILIEIQIQIQHIPTKNKARIQKTAYLIQYLFFFYPGIRGYMQARWQSSPLIFFISYIFAFLFIILYFVMIRASEGVCRLGGNPTPPSLPFEQSLLESPRNKYKVKIEIQIQIQIQDCKVID